MMYIGDAKGLFCGIQLVNKSLDELNYVATIKVDLYFNFH